MKKLMIVCSVSIFIVVSLQTAEEKLTLVTIDEQFIEAYKQKRKDAHRALAAEIAQTTQAAEKTQKGLIDPIPYLKQLKERIERNNQSLEGLRTKLSQNIKEELTIMITGISIATLPTITQDREKLFKKISEAKEENKQLKDTIQLVKKVYKL
jgi:hypothetical protein